MDKTNQPSNANKASSQRNSAAWRARTIVTMLAVATTLVFTSCDDFIFGNVNINYNDNPLEAKPIPHSGADKYVDSLKKIRTTQPMANPDLRTRNSTITPPTPMGHSPTGLRAWPCSKKGTRTATV